MARNLRPGQVCVVATPGELGGIVLTRFRFTHEEDLPNPTDGGRSCRVLFGERLGSETLSRSRAVRSTVYRAFFDRLRRFKQWSVIHPR